MRRLVEQSSIQKGQDGVTLLELLVVVVIMGVIALISLPRVPTGFLGAPAELTAAQDQLVGELRRARDRALGCGLERRLLVVPTEGPGGQVVFDAADEPCGEGPYSIAFPDRVVLQVSGGDSGFLFSYPEGRVRDNDGVVGENIEWTLTADGAGHPEVVCVYAATGRIAREECS